METGKRELGVPPPDAGEASAQDGAWVQRWWRSYRIRIGVLPLPVWLLLLAPIVALTLKGKLAADLPTGIAMLALGGFACAELAYRLPFVRHVGAASIIAAFLPAALVYYGWLPAPLVKAVTDFTKHSNVLYLFIAGIIVGSVLSMDRRTLIAGFLRIFVPLAAGSIVAAGVGTAVGTALGMGAHHTFFFVVAPIMAGGVGEGAIPLSLAYAQRLGQSQGPLFAQALSSVMLGNIASICVAGVLNLLGERRPAWTGHGRLTADAGHSTALHRQEAPFDVTQFAAAGAVAIGFYLVGGVAHAFFGWPAPVVMLLLAVFAQLGQAVAPDVRDGARHMYRFFSGVVTYPLMFAISVAMTPWDKIASAFHWANIVTAVSVVVSLSVTGFFVGRWMKMYPIESALINATHSGLGGTGDVAILTAANRMNLMPFAQIATRIGGAITVIVALSLFSMLH